SHVIGRSMSAVRPWPWRSMAIHCRFFVSPGNQPATPPKRAAKRQFVTRTPTRSRKNLKRKLLLHHRSLGSVPGEGALPGYRETGWLLLLDRIEKEQDKCVMASQARRVA